MRRQAAPSSSRKRRLRFGLPAFFGLLAVCSIFFALIHYMDLGGAVIVAYLVAPYIVIPLCLRTSRWRKDR